MRAGLCMYTEEKERGKIKNNIKIYPKEIGREVVACFL